MRTLGKIAGIVAAIFAMGFLGILSLFSPDSSDKLFRKWLEWSGVE